MKTCHSCHARFREGSPCPGCGTAWALQRIGDTVSGFEITDWIADGPVATVYRAQRGTERVAIKIYAPHRSPAHGSQRIDRERAAQSRVAHACVARLLDWGSLDDNSMYLVSEWVEGALLETRLAAGTMSFDELEPIMRAVGRGLNAIHGAGIVHRDLKPTNIILPTDRPEAAMVLDFGHSLVLGEGRLTDTGQILGTATYTAPEQAVGGAIDGRADLYALGVILYRALCGVAPFVDVSAAEVLRKHVSEPVVAPRVRAPAACIPSAAEALCLWLLAKRPAARVPNARVLAITLESLARTQAPAARKENVV